MRVNDERLEWAIKNYETINPTGILRLLLDLKEARAELKELKVQSDRCSRCRRSIDGDKVCQSCYNSVTYR
jgi:hypothetical protein